MRWSQNTLEQKGFVWEVLSHFAGPSVARRQQHTTLSSLRVSVGFPPSLQKTHMPPSSMYFG